MCSFSDLLGLGVHLAGTCCNPMLVQDCFSLVWVVCDGFIKVPLEEFSNLCTKEKLLKIVCAYVSSIFCHGL